MYEWIEYLQENGQKINRTTKDKARHHIDACMKQYIELYGRPDLERQYGAAKT